MNKKNRMDRVCRCHRQLFSSEAERWRHEYDELLEQESKEMEEMDRMEESLVEKEREFSEAVQAHRQQEEQWEGDYMVMLDQQDEVDTLEGQVEEAERKLVGHLLGANDDVAHRQAA